MPDNLNANVKRIVLLSIEPRPRKRWPHGGSRRHSWHLQDAGSPRQFMISGHRQWLELAKAVVVVRGTESSRSDPTELFRVGHGRFIP